MAGKSGGKCAGRLPERHEKGEVESLTLYGESEERLFIVGKPGFYHITIF